MKTIEKSNLWHGLYILHAFPNKNVDCSAALTSSLHCNSVAFNTWHDRLGHLSFKHLSALKDVLPIVLPKSTHNFTCMICPIAKQRRLKFYSHNHLAENLFDLVHCDIWGPYQTPSYAGFHYFLTIVDDCSRYTWVFLMQNKYDALHIVPRFFKLVETQYGACIKQFKSDNAPELIFKEFFNSKESFTNSLVFLSLSRTLLSSASTNIYLMLLGLYYFSLGCLSIFGVNAY